MHQKHFKSFPVALKRLRFLDLTHLLRLKLKSFCIEIIFSPKKHFNSFNSSVEDKTIPE